MTVCLRIVVADDEPDMREYFQRILPRLGHDVVGVASNGRQLIELCRQLGPDLVITDVQMPELDGIDAARQVYADHPVPIVLVSAYHDRQLIDRAGAVQVMAYLVKPVKQADLEAAVPIARRRFQEFRAIERQAAALRQAVARSHAATDDGTPPAGT